MSRIEVYGVFGPDITSVRTLDSEQQNIHDQLLADGYKKVFIFDSHFTVGRGFADISVRSSVVSRGGLIHFTFRGIGKTRTVQVTNSGSNELKVISKSGQENTVSTSQTCGGYSLKCIRTIEDGDKISIISQKSSLFELKIHIVGGGIIVGVKDDVIT